MSITTGYSKYSFKHVMLSRLVFLFRQFLSLRILRDVVEYKKMISRCKTNLDSNVVEPKIDLGPKVSIVVPTLNEAETLPRLFHSISSQTYSNIEVIVVDAQSLDGTAIVAEELCAKVITASTKSVGYQSDVGARASSGEIIIRCDADSIFPPQHVERVVTTFQSNTNAKVVHCGHWYYDGSFLDNFVAFLYDRYWRRLDGTSGAMTAIRREAYVDIGGYNPQMIRGEDFDLGRRALEKYGRQGIVYDKNLVTPISARAIRKHGRLHYFRTRGRSFSN